jgi:hypothetical protein
MANSITCTRCKRVLPVPAAPTSGSIRCPACGHIQVIATPATRQPDAAGRDTARHLGCELHNLQTQTRLLSRLRECFDAGLRDPELLYLGGRYAASLGLETEACRFLDPLTALLCEAGKPPPQSFFPIGLLYLHVLPDGTRRDEVRQRLEAMTATSEALRHVWDVVGHGSASAKDAPARLLQTAKDALAGIYSQLLAPGGGGTTPTSGPLAAQNLAHRATEGYHKGVPELTRKALEDLLLVDGDQPDVLRNLITVTSEEHDVEAYERYGRRYVKVLVWRMMRADAAVAAWVDLIRFYSKVATTTDREFVDVPASRMSECLRMPGLLSRWVESHAALIWLDSVDTSDAEHATPSALMHYWFRVFYPEFSPYLDVDADDTETNQAWWRHQTRTTRLQFDPAQKLLCRFAEWSRYNFAFRKGDEHNSAHFQTCAALVGCAARIPLRPHIRELQKVLEANEINPKPFRRVIQEAFGMPLWLRLRPLLDQKERDWSRILTFYDDSVLLEHIAADMRLFQALALCMTKKEEEGLDRACELVPAMTEDETKDDSQASVLWHNVLEANIGRAFKEQQAQRAGLVASVKAKIDALPNTTTTEAFRQGCLDHIEEVVVIIDTQDLVKAGKFEDARQRACQLKEKTEASRKLKQDLLKQIAEAEASEKLNKLVEETLARVKELVGRDKFDEARRVTRALPDTPEDLKKLKADILKQIGEVEGSAKLNKLVDETLARVKELVGRDKFDEARRVTRALPDTPEDLKKLKADILKQIDDVAAQAKKQAELKNLIDATFTRVEQLLKYGDRAGAIAAINSLPDFPPEVAAIKKDWLKQISGAW